MNGKLRARLSELEAWEGLIEDFPTARARVLGEVLADGESLPIVALALGSERPDAPTLALVGGVHGIERIGSQVIIAYLATLKVALTWDQTLRDLFEKVRLVALPMVNPVGMARGFRANGNGVDLMRNAPVQAEVPGRWFELHRGQRLSHWLPWYRGNAEQMEAEAQTLCDWVRREVYPSSVGICVDVHSGMLKADRIWFPYARSTQAFPGIAETTALCGLLHETYPHHRYIFEPQALNYTTHGDLWDFIYDEQRSAFPDQVLLPLTLELSSVSWYRKNPRQLLSRIGLFHPVTPRRVARVLHRHKALFDFLLRALFSQEAWLPNAKEQRATLRRQAAQLWPGIDVGSFEAR